MKTLHPLPALLARILFAAALAAVALAQPASAQQEKTKTERLLGEELNEFAADENGWSHLHWAAAANDAEAARRLLEMGAAHSPVALDDNSPFSPEGKSRASLLGLDMSQWKNTNDTPIKVAAFFKHHAVVSILASHGAFSLDSLRETPPPTDTETEKYFRELPEEWEFEKLDANNEWHLYVAAEKNDMKAASWLIANGADVNLKNKGGGTPLHYAARKNAHDVAALLIDNGADVNARGFRGYTPLHRAAEENAREVAALLIKNGADVNAKMNTNYTPVDIAILVKLHEMQSLLRSHGGRCNKKC